MGEDRLPKVSIGVPAIGRESLRDTIESILNQTYQNLEIIISDDTEDKRAYPIVLPYLSKDSRIKYVVNNKYRHGVVGNINNCLDHMTGEYVTFFADDDIYAPNAIEELISVAIQGGYRSVFANCLDQYGRYTGKHYGKDEEVDYVDFLCGRYEGEYIGLLHRSLLDNDRYIDECWGSDMLTNFKLLKRANKSFYIHKVLRYYRFEGEDSATVKMYSPYNFYGQMLNYVHVIDSFLWDFKRCCPGQILRWAIPGMAFASLSGNRGRVLWFLRKTFEGAGLRGVLIIPWAGFCLVAPQRILLTLWRGVFSKGLRDIVKAFLRRI